MLSVRVMREREVVRGATDPVRHAAGPAALGATRRRAWVDEEAVDELSLFREDLNAIAAALAHVDETVWREVDDATRR